MLKRIFVAVFVALSVVALIVSAYGLGISNANFGQVEQGKTYNSSVTIITSSRGFDNHFVVEKSGDLAGWVTTISPTEFDLKAGGTKTVTITLTVPEDARLGEYEGGITAVGKRVVGGGGAGAGETGVGYTVATKSRLYARVVKPGAVEAAAITLFKALKTVAPGDIAKFDIAVKNTGNIPTTAVTSLLITKGEANITTIPAAPMELNVDDEKSVKLFWDTEGVAEGEYSAVASVIAGENMFSSEPVAITVGTVGVSAYYMIAIAVVIAIVVITGVMLFLRRRKS